MVLELTGIGLVALAAFAILVEQIMQAQPRPVPLHVMTDERQRRAAERLLAERLFDRHDRRL
jgi:CHASE2 domain-containing sensor protein